MARKKKEKNPEEIDNKFEFGAFVIKHWLKAIAIILAGGLAFSGFSVKCGKNEMTKDPAYQIKSKDKK